MNVTGFVHLLSPVKQSRSSETKFFNAVIQSDDDNYVKMVCFSPAKRKILADAENEKEAVVITNVTRSPSKLRCFNEEIKVSDNSGIRKADSEEVAFGHKEFEDEKPSTFSSIKSLKEMNAGEFVSFKGFAHVEDRAAVPVTLSYSKQELLVKEIIVNDETGTTISVNVWGDLIECVKSNGCYEFINANLKKSREVMTDHKH